jgi:prepilin-type N-terminal cleavage/methylation domain-containing protein
MKNTKNQIPDRQRRFAGRFQIRAGGMSLLEVLVVITIFAVLGVLVTQSIVLTLQGSKKSESMMRARENLNYSLGIIERQIRGAISITSPCPNTEPGEDKIINYLDQNGSEGSFSCQQMGTDNSHVASGSARLTNDAVMIVDCSFICSLGTGANPDLITVRLALKEASASGAQSASVSASTQIYLRNY